MDKARIGQQGTLTNVSSRTGSRLPAVKQARYKSCYLYPAAEPATGEAAALVAPNVNTGMMSEFLKILADERRDGEHVVLIPNGAGWHKSKGLALPEGITVLLLPPNSHELDPVENIWHHLRSHLLSNGAYEGYDPPMDATINAYRKLTPEVLESACACQCLEGRTNKP